MTSGAFSRQLDLRLLPAAVLAWAWAFWLVAAPVPLSLLVAAGGGLVGVASVVWRWPSVGVAAAAGLAVAAGVAVHAAALHRGPLPAIAAADRAVRLDLSLTGDPAAIVSRHGHPLVLVTATGIAVRRSAGSAWMPAAGVAILVLAPSPSGWLGLLPGQRVEVSGLLGPPQAGDAVAAVLLARGPPTPYGSPPWWQRGAGRLRRDLRAATREMPPDERGLLPGLAVGDRAAMSPGLVDAFRVAGLTHLVAVSGENVALLLAAVLGAARWVLVPRRGRAVVGAIVLAGFVVLVRPSPSVVRAATMGSLLLLGLLLGRRARPLPALCAAVVVLLVADPWLARDIGFALSVAATFGLLVLAAPIRRRLRRAGLPAPLAAAISLSVAAQVACTPLLVAVFGQLTPYAVLANLAAAPAVAGATIAGVLAAVTAPLCPPLAAALAWVGVVPTGWICLVARVTARLPLARAGPGSAAGIALTVGLTALPVLVVVCARRRSAIAGRAAAARGWPG